MDVLGIQSLNDVMGTCIVIVVIARLRQRELSSIEVWWGLR